MERTQDQVVMRFRRGMTLIELLFVMGIVLALIGFLVPVANRARQSANTVGCENRMREVGNAFALYANDWHGAFPGTVNQYSKSGTKAAREGWKVDALPSYIGGPQVSQIQNLPADWSRRILEWHAAGPMTCTVATDLLPSYNAAYGTFSLNAALDNPSWKAGNGWVVTQRNLPAALTGGSVQCPPSRFAVVFDAATYLEKSGPAFSPDCSGDANDANPTLPHGGTKWVNSRPDGEKNAGYFADGKGNVLFADWHVETLGAVHAPGVEGVPFLGSRHDQTAQRPCWPFWWGVQ